MALLVGLACGESFVSCSELIVCTYFRRLAEACKFIGAIHRRGQVVKVAMRQPSGDEPLRSYQAAPRCAAYRDGAAGASGVHVR